MSLNLVLTTRDFHVIKKSLKILTKFSSPGVDIVVKNFYITKRPTELVVSRSTHVNNKSKTHLKVAYYSLKAKLFSSCLVAYLFLLRLGSGSLGFSFKITNSIHLSRHEIKPKYSFLRLSENTFYV